MRVIIMHNGASVFCGNSTACHYASAAVDLVGPYPHDGSPPPMAFVFQTCLTRGLRYAPHKWIYHTNSALKLQLNKSWNISSAFTKIRITVRKMSIIDNYYWNWQGKQHWIDCQNIYCTFLAYHIRKFSNMARVRCSIIGPWYSNPYSII